MEFVGRRRAGQLAHSLNKCIYHPSEPSKFQPITLPYEEGMTVVPGMTVVMGMTVVLGMTVEPGMPVAKGIIAQIQLLLGGPHAGDRPWVFATKGGSLTR